MNNKLRIAIVLDQFLVGGVPLTAIEQVRGLNKLGHTATLLLLMRKKYAVDTSSFLEGIPHEYISDSYPLFFRRTMKFPIFSFLSTLHVLSPFLAPWVIRKNQYDVLVSHGTSTCIAVRAISRAFKIPYIAVIYDPMGYILEKAYAATFLRYFFAILHPLAYFFERSFIRDAKKTIIISSMHRTYLQNRYGITPEILISGAKAIPVLPRWRGDTILAFGRWDIKKNPMLLLDILEKLPGESLVIAGTWTNPEELKAFRAMLIKKKLQGRVRIVPYYDEDMLFVLCADARVFIHSHPEAFGIAALEAAGHGLPIIIPAEAGVSGLFQHGVHGFFPQSISADEYVRYIALVLRDERIAHAMGEKAWQVVRTTYSWDENAKGLLKHVQTALGT